MLNLLIIGDSFSSDSSGWAAQLPEYNVTNLSSNGSSEYRILKKLMIEDLTKYDQVIMVHTSPNRIYITHNPMHIENSAYQDCDLIYQDVLAQNSEFSNHVVWWFHNVFDLEHANDMHQLLIEKSMTLLKNKPSLHLSFFESYGYSEIHNLNHIWQRHPGQINHLSNKGNQMVVNFVKQHL